MDNQSQRPNVFVVRTSDHDKEFICSELQQGRLRQGWGITGMHLTEEGASVPLSDWMERYARSAEKAWGVTEGAGTRFRILQILLEIRSGDLIVVPKIPDSSSFAIVLASGSYSWDESRGDSDFGHMISVNKEVTKHVNYRASNESRYVMTKLRGYRSAVNRVWDLVFWTSVWNIFQTGTGTTPVSAEDLFAENRDNALSGLLTKVRQFPPLELERLVSKAFLGAGYAELGRNRYNRKGGDADRIFSFRLPIVGESNEQPFYVFVQVKQKTGVDEGDIEGIEQLLSISADKPGSLRVLVSTADEFSAVTLQRASEHGIALIAGAELVRLLSKYVDS